jgi:hypothetical protein
MAEKMLSMLIKKYDSVSPSKSRAAAARTTLGHGVA